MTVQCAKCFDRVGWYLAINLTIVVPCPKDGRPDCGTSSPLGTRSSVSSYWLGIRTFAKSPFLLLGTVDRHGRGDVSPRGDVPSAAKVLDSKTLVLAERPGNRRADSLKNIVESAD
jgi:hypothetical protein